MAEDECQYPSLYLCCAHFASHGKMSPKCFRFVLFDFKLKWPNHSIPALANINWVYGIGQPNAGSCTVIV